MSDKAWKVGNVRYFKVWNRVEDKRRMDVRHGWLKVANTDVGSYGVAQMYGALKMKLFKLRKAGSSAFASMNGYLFFDWSLYSNMMNDL